MTIRPSLAIALAPCIAIASCAGTPEDRPVADADVVRSLLVKDDTGLSVRQLVVADDADAFAEAMHQWDSNGIDEAALKRLRRNGFRLVRLPVDELDRMIAQLGGATMDITSWQGQVYEWRDLHQVALGRGRMLAVDGRVVRYEGGELQLMMRSWVVPMEDGPRMLLDLVPQHLHSQSRYRQLLNQEGDRATPLPSLATQVLLEPGYAYVLTCECPQQQWNGSAQASAGDDEARTPGPSVGPDAAVPQTIGQMMLTSASGRPSRGMLVFIPRIAARLFPPDHPHAEALARRNGEQR